jgi:transposase InsO family protein
MTRILLSFICALLRSTKSRRELALENLVLRQQLAVLKRSVKRPKLTASDRAFWSILLRWWPRWRDALVIVRPATVVAWHRKGFRMFWKWKSRKRCGRPKVEAEIRALVRQMARANVGWGAPRIHGELLKLGLEISQATVSRYMPRRRGPPSQTWRSFLDNHLASLASIDFFVVPTATFRLLFGFVVLLHQRRQVAHFNVTANPTAQWTAQQIVEAFPDDTAPSYMIRDRDCIYGADFVARIEGMGIEDTPTAPGSPWQNPFVERLIGSIRRDCLDHVVVFGERHLRSILGSYFEYYHDSRTHLSLGKDTPNGGRDVEPTDHGNVVAFPRVGGLHHRYMRERKAA